MWVRMNSSLPASRSSEYELRRGNEERKNRAAV
jgi:hypothetical protein